MILIYTHIPKTGGNTFASVLYNQYHYQREVCSVYLRDNIPPNVNFNKIKLVVGHQQFGLHKQIPKPCKYLTMLRNPIDRVVSDYYFDLKFRGKKPEEAPFEAFIAKYSNRQTRWIAGEDREELQLAKYNIEHSFIAVGITEMFNESLFLMKQKLKWGNITYKQYNVNDKRPKSETISDRHITCIKKHNALDIALYNWVKQRFENELKQLDAISREQLAAYKRHSCKGYSTDYADPYDFIE